MTPVCFAWPRVDNTQPECRDQSPAINGYCMTITWAQIASQDAHVTESCELTRVDTSRHEPPVSMTRLGSDLWGG